MIITDAMIKKQLVNYSNKNTKLGREVKEGKLLKIKNGLYETNPNVQGYLLAGSIYGPSYLSFDFALSYYGLIPERVDTFTSATFGKKKKKKYKTPFGVYTFRDVPESVYPIGIELVNYEEYSYQIATIEKALCDKLYTLSPLKNIENLKNLLFQDLRIEKEELEKLDIDSIEKISNLYGSSNVNLLFHFLRRKKDE